MSDATRTRGRHGRRAWLVAGLLTTALVTACAGNDSAGGRDGAAGDGERPADTARTVAPGAPVSDEHIELLTVGIPGKVTLVDPADNMEAGLNVNQLGLEPLLRIAPDGSLQPWLATEWEQVSDTVYEYTLRDGVTFWDGTELTAEDVKYSWDHLRAPESRRATYFAAVDTVEAVDADTVRVTLKQPDASWQYTPAMWYSVIFQKKFAEETGEAFGQPGTLLVATGPWKFDSVNPASGMELSAYDDYWGGTPPIDRISVRSFADDNSMALALRAGEIDLAPVVGGPTGFDAAAGGNTVTTVETCGTARMSLPTRRAPWDDVHVRRAVAYAINRDDIVAAAQGSAAGPAVYAIAPQLFRTLGSEEEVQAALEEIETYPFDLDAARAELAQSSVPDGFSFDLTIPPSSAAIAEVIAAQLGEIGIDISVEVLPDTAWYAALREDVRPLTFSATGACTPDPDWDSIFFDTDEAGEPIGLNMAQYSSPEVTGLWAEGLLEQDPAQRLRIYTDLQKQVAEDVPYISLFAEGTTYASTTYDLVEYHSYFWMNLPWALNLVPK
ncbi:ABC transporter substrate-binding protein [Jiangella alkaliphila]|uniref:Peptide/nickel transport system substrate-binding protein n=1 Tax=Jiangella alkaliphila TaxID=419479 RepID=A0A1H2ISI6_9ACTN|nr:ABC transporter substrate-binding protein [Jiangella alkaliphila]SDU46856.1 peptide/nickel transport system substrate-binding protein [Jiangella alkaliphila]